jgi:hypothetical protein
MSTDKRQDDRRLLRCLARIKLLRTNTSPRVQSQAVGRPDCTFVCETVVHQPRVLVVQTGSRNLSDDRGQATIGRFSNFVGSVIAMLTYL